MRIGVWLAVLVLAASAADAQAATKPRLKAFRSCADLVSFARQGALRTGGGVGVVPRALPPGGGVIVTPPIRRTDLPEAVSAPTAGDQAAPFSGTNTQEAGVDEPDVVKTDGRRIFAVTDGELRIVDVTGAAPRVAGTLKLEGYDQRLLVHGDRVLAIASRGLARIVPIRGVPVPAVDTIGSVSAQTIVSEIDVSDSAHPSVRRSMTVPGRFVDARQNGGTARLVIDAAPRPIAVPAIRRARLARFLGHTVLHSHLTGRTYRRPLAHCDQIRRPRQFSGLDVLAILTVDLERGMYSLDRDGVMAGAQVVYGSAGSLYVASRRYDRGVELGTGGPDDVATEIHRFDISDPDRTVYRASGRVPGFVLNSYALSEYQDDLRVATTEDAPWDAQGESSSRLTVLRQDGTALKPVGVVGGLGKGQRIYGVRYLGDKAFVVTFREVDPLYAIDLSVPTAPKVRGELELPGYSAYLHPITSDLLLGVGREGAGVKASLFDVSNLAAPKQVASLALGDGATTTEFDRHAFLYWAPAKLAVLPLTTFGRTPFDGAVGVRVGDELSVAGRIEHHNAERDADASIDRSLVVGDRLYTVSYLGLAASRLDTLQPVGFLAF
jgi:Beta propeller domain